MASAYRLVGIGVLVEILRRLGFAFATVRERERRAESEEPANPAPPPYS